MSNVYDDHDGEILYADPARAVEVIPAPASGTARMVKEGWIYNPNVAALDVHLIFRRNGFERERKVEVPGEDVFNLGMIIRARSDRKVLARLDAALSSQQSPWFFVSWADVPR